MKKRMAAAFLCAVMMSLISVCASAANHISEIAIDVTLRDDGSAYVVQNWRGTFTEGTENYLPIDTDGIKIENFEVFDKDGEYEFEENWDVNASFEEKSRKCGIVETENGVELCFGISQYGENRYAFSYIIDGFVKSYTDYDGTNFMFVNPGMTTFPTDCTVRITAADGTALNDENSAIWAFGYEGNIEFSDGSVLAYTTRPVTDGEKMIVMLRLNKGIVSPSMSSEESFENVKEEAFYDSDYTMSQAARILILLAVLAFLLIVFAVIVSAVKRRAAIRKFYKQTPYFRDTPNGGDIKMSHYLARKFSVSDDDSAIIGALILSMISKGALEPETEEKESFIGRKKTSVSLRLICEPKDGLEARLYSILEAACGADGILQEKELKSYAQENPEKLKDFVDGTLAEGKVNFINEGGFVKGKRRTIANLSANGKKRLGEVMGLKKYLEEFSLISEREIGESAVWQEYMVYALLFGIADRVEEQLKKIYPDKTGEIDVFAQNVIIAQSYNHMIYSSYMRGLSDMRSSGMGGASSIGGGGGFSGGGFGGGSR